MPCEAENPNVPVVLGLAYDPSLHSCNWPDQLLQRGCDPAERLGGFTCPSLAGDTTASCALPFLITTSQCFQTLWALSMNSFPPSQDLQV